MKLEPVRLKYVTALGYGNAVESFLESESGFPVFGSNGIYGWTDVANTKAPAIVVGRKGSYGKLNWSVGKAFASDTTFFIDEMCTGHNLRWLYWSLGTLGLDEGSGETAVPGINRERIYEQRVPLPSLEQQVQIAAYLDRETFAIDTLIVEKESMLGLLEEKRQALVSHAVTQGLDPKAKMKPTGIEWLGKVPSHWKVERLKFQLSQSIDQGWSPTCENRLTDDDEWAVLKVGCVNGDRFDPQEHKALPVEHEPQTRFEIQEDDILLSRGNTLELVGSASVVPRVRSKLMLCDLLYRFRVDSAVLDPRFAVLQLRSKLGRFQLEREANGTSGSMKKIGQGTIQNFVVLIPSRAEQDRILAVVEIETSRMDTIRNVTLDSIRLLRERRSALITAAVTGQIKL